MNFILDIPLPLRFGIIAILGLFYAAAVNWGIYQLSFFHRHIGPWSKQKPDTGSYCWSDCIPIVGWWRLRRFSSQFGKFFWVRPLLLEIGLPVFLVWLYQFEINGGLLPQQNSIRRLLPAMQPALHVQYLAHALLLWGMCVATFIDFDEQLIPDWVTVPGVLLGLLGSAYLTGWHLFIVDRSNVLQAKLASIHACTPGEWRSWLDGEQGLWLALFCYSGWCFGLLDRRWIARRGISKAIQYFLARLVRYRPWFVTVVLLWSVGIIAIVLAYQTKSVNWQALISALIGMAIAGGIVWAVRIVASNALGIEAMGFGDVTLMAMIGTFIGWQPSLLVFFLAPLTSLAFVLIAWFLTGKKDYPFGPYLCFATLILLLGWDGIWNRWAATVFELGTVLLAILLIALVAMGVMLTSWRWIRDRFIFGGE